MSPLDKVLLRDLWRQKTQVMAIMVVMALGVLILVMMEGLVSTLLETKAAYYERQRFADAYAPVVRAPASVVAQVEALEGVKAAEGRLASSAQIHTLRRGSESLFDDQIAASVLSLPDFGEPRLNNILIMEGRVPSASSAKEVVVLHAFYKAQGLALGDEIDLKIQGELHAFTIVGAAMAPEFLYVTAPGEIAPDPKRFAALWLAENALAPLLSMEGAINEILLDLDRGADLESVLSTVEDRLERYGSLGAYGQADQPSNRYLSEELMGLQVSSTVVPPIFLAISAFLLNMVVARMVQAQRKQIGLLKAFGYTGMEIAKHYMKFVLITAVGGAALGAVLGIILGQYLAEYFQVYFKFPFLIFSVDPATFAYSFLVSVGAGSAGGALVMFRVFRLTPTEAMQPTKPEDYSGSSRVFDLLKPVLDQSSRMIIRHVMRHRVKSLLSAIGLAAGMGLSVAMLGTMSGFERAIYEYFSVVDRSDITVSFVRPVSIQALNEIEQVPGVIYAEPQRHVPTTFQSASGQHKGLVSGFTRAPLLGRVMDPEGTELQVRTDGLTLSTALANKMGVSVGDRLRLEIQDLEKTVVTVPVVATSTTLLGAPAYMEIEALGEILGSHELMTSAKLQLEDGAESAVLHQLDSFPNLASATLQSTIRASFQELMDRGAGVTRYIMLLVSAIITFGITYNAARIAFSERAHDLASLEIIGMTKGEVGYILLGEMLLVTLVALPLGAMVGFLLTDAIARGFSTDLYTIPAEVAASSVALAGLSVIASALISALFMLRDVYRLDIISALKSRE